MRKKKVGAIAIKSRAAGCAWYRVPSNGTGCHDNLSKHGPIEQYLVDRTAEIALARSAAPESVPRGAEVLVLGHRTNPVRGLPVSKQFPHNRDRDAGPCSGWSLHACRCMPVVACLDLRPIIMVR
jgi:hypothetical protein